MAKTQLNGNRLAYAWLMSSVVLVTVLFWTSLNDPFNAPKSWVLSITGFWLVGWVITQIKTQCLNKTLRLVTVLAGFFVLALSASWIATDNKFVGFFGEYQRRNGLLSDVSLIGFLLSAAYLVRLNRIKFLERSVITTGFITGIYGFTQHFKHDFVHWKNPFNPVISTLGNPDFAAAVMAIFLTFNFGILIQKAQPLIYRVSAAFNVLLLATVIIFSQVRQGLLSAALGIIVIVIVWIYQKSKKVAYGVTAISFIGGAFALIGMLNVGPMAKYFYKVSVTYRGDYWRAAWKMFIHHPLFGVGLDRYGANFRKYRDATQSLRRGPDVISTAAHDIPLQLASTGGIFVLLAFFALASFIFYRGIATIRKTQGQEQLIAVAIFGAWLAYEVQSLVSVDNLGIAIWGYLLGGAVIGISVKVNPGFTSSERKSSYQPFLSAILAIGLVVLSSFFFKSESAMYNLNRTQVPKSPSNFATYSDSALKPISYSFIEPSYVVMIADKLAQVGNFDKATSLLKQEIINDPNNYGAQHLLAHIYEFQKNLIGAIDLRKSMIKLDPFNQTNLLQLGEDYKYQGNKTSAKQIVTLINAFAPNSAEAKQAQTDFGN
jgi:O-antigen ligase